MQKRRFGDRKDAKLVRNIDGMHFIMPRIYPNRTDNEAFVSERIDLTNLKNYLVEKNKTLDHRISIFQAMVAIVLKTIYLRPKMNYFVKNKRLFARNEVSASFVIKKYYGDEASEGLAFLRAKPEDTIDSLHAELDRQIYQCKKSNVKDASSNALDFFAKLPTIISGPVVELMRWFDKHGWVPQSLIDTDPYYASAILTNLGSIKLHSGYHHLTNWGTTSIFVIFGERKKRPVFHDDKTFDLIDSIDLGLTIDERIADGYYFSKTIRLVKYLFAHPQLLERPLSEGVDFE